MARTPVVVYDPDWDTLQILLDEYLDAGHAKSFKDRQALIPIRDFIWCRTEEGRQHG